MRAKSSNSAVQLCAKKNVLRQIVELIKCWLMRKSMQKKKRKRAKLSKMNNPHCDITIPSLVVEQQLTISMKIYVRN